MMSWGGGINKRKKKEEKCYEGAAKKDIFFNLVRSKQNHKRVRNKKKKEIEKRTKE